MVGDEVERRYPDVDVEYVDVNENPSLLSEKLIHEIQERSLFWPISTVNETIFYDGLITLPKVISAIEEEQSRLARLADAPESNWS
ncbi:MAG: DUF1462 family protein [Coriobacteriia bacterium]|nr:DUF1462 family protein [Coriobacteriia bacterium]